MRLSEIKLSDVVDFLRLEEEEYSESTMQAVMSAAKSYILEYTGLSAEAADEKADLWLAYMVLCQDMHDNRSMYVEKDNVNKVVKSILNMHCVNLL